MTITVVNKYKEPNHIYCGRGTPLGNPFRMGDEDMRDTVCDQYETWFYKQVSSEVFDMYIQGAYPASVMNPIIPALASIFNEAKFNDINLGCFCAPKRCHCDTIKTFLNNKLEEYFK